MNEDFVDYAGTGGGRAVWLGLRGDQRNGCCFWSIDSSVFSKRREFENVEFGRIGLC